MIGFKIFFYLLCFTRLLSNGKIIRNTLFENIIEYTFRDGNFVWMDSLFMNHFACYIVLNGLDSCKNRALFKWKPIEIIDYCFKRLTCCIDKHLALDSYMSHRWSLYFDMNENETITIYFRGSFGLGESSEFEKSSL
jgi:hypothetical protein